MKDIYKISLVGESMVGKTSFIYSLLKDDVDDYMKLREIVRENNKGQTKIQINYLFECTEDPIKDYLLLDNIKFNETTLKDNQGDGNPEKICNAKRELCNLLDIKENVIEFDDNLSKSNKLCEYEIKRGISLDLYKKLVNNASLTNIIKSITIRVIPNESFSKILKEYNFNRIIISDCRGFLDENKDTRKKYDELMGRISCDNDIKTNDKGYAEYLLEEKGLVDTDCVVLMTRGDGIKLTEENQTYYRFIFEYFNKHNNSIIITREKFLTKAYKDGEIKTKEEYLQIHQKGSEKYKKFSSELIDSYTNTIKTIKSILKNSVNEMSHYTIPYLYSINNEEIDYQEELKYYKNVQIYLLDIILSKIKEMNNTELQASKILSDDKEFKNKLLSDLKTIIENEVGNDDYVYLNHFNYGEGLLNKIKSEFNAGESGLVGPQYGLTKYIAGYGRIGKGAYAINRYCYEFINKIIENWKQNDDIRYKIIAEAFNVSLKENSIYYYTFASRFMYVYKLDKIIKQLKLEESEYDCKYAIKYILFEFIKIVIEYIINIQKK